MNLPQQLKQISKEFDNRFVDEDDKLMHDKYASDDIKLFISKLLKQQKKEITNDLSKIIDNAYIDKDITNDLIKYIQNNRKEK